RRRSEARDPPGARPGARAAGARRARPAFQEEGARGVRKVRVTMRVSSACGLALAAGLAGCSLDPIDYKGKGCPCLADLTCQIVPRQCIVAPGAPQPSLGCVIYTDGMLYCGNASGSQMRSAPRASAPVVDTLRTSYSWFICWGTGELHAGGNTTWYYTEGDD